MRVTIDTHPLYVAYLRGVDMAVVDARRALIDHLGDPDGYAKALARLRECREIADAAYLQAYGEPCVRCRNEADEPTGYVEVYHARTDEYELQPCPACGGALKVLPAERRPEWPKARDWSDDEQKGID